VGTSQPVKGVANPSFADTCLCRREAGEMEKEGFSLGYPVGAYAEERVIEKIKTNFGKLISNKLLAQAWGSLNKPEN